MNFNGVNNLMRQQLGAIKDLEELLDLSVKPDATREIPQEGIDLLASHVDHLKKICETAMALAQHYQKAEKSSTVVVDPDDSDDEGETPDVKEPVKKTRVKKEKPTVPKEPEPAVEEDDFEDLLS